MIKVISGCVLIAGFVAGCNSSSATSEPYVNPDSLKAATIVVPTPGNNPANALPQRPAPQPVVTPAPVTQPAAQVTTTPMPAQAAPTAAGMNPPHGQPNHRCDIAVGAPLSTPIQKPAAGAQPTAVAGQPTVINTTTPVKTPKGMNPPHGEPNHRCDIAVGAPLNSPVTKPAVTTPVVMPAPTAAPEPVKDSAKG